MQKDITEVIEGLSNEIAEMKKVIQSLAPSINGKDELLRGRQIWEYVGWSESYASKSSTKALLVVGGHSILRKEGKSYVAYRSDLDKYLQRNPRSIK